MALFTEPDGTGRETRETKTRYNARVADVITGFRPDPKNNSFWGTPVELTTDDRGFLYLTSDRFTQAVFRIEASPLQGAWETPPPDTLLADAPLHLDSVIRLRRPLEGPGETQLTADLSAVSGPEELALQRIDDTTFWLRTELSAGPLNRRKDLVIHLEQGEESTTIIHSLVVLPKADQALFASEMLWKQGVLFGAELDPTQTDTSLGRRPPTAPTAVHEQAQDSTPRDFALDPNYPNPFNSSTTFGYRLDKASKVQLEIYDSQGQKVKTLVDRNEGPGFYRLEWDGTNTGGYPVATGVYLLRLQSQEAVEVHKMLLLK